MLLLEMFAAEARRNPDQNPKTTAIEALAPLKNDPDIFISFVDDVGRLSTPSVLKSPFGDIELPPRNGSGTKIGVHPRTVHTVTPGGIYFYPLREIWPDLVGRNIPFASGRPFLYVVRAKGEVLDLAAVTDAELDRGCEKLKLILVKDRSDEEAAAFIEKALASAPVQTPGGKLWFAIQAIAFELARSDASRPWLWNSIIRSLGYAGAVDRKGEGIISHYEPAQAVFMTKSAFEVVDRLRNDTMKA